MIIAVSTSNKPWEEIGMPATALAYYRLSSSLLIRKAFKGKRGFITFIWHRFYVPIKYVGIGQGTLSYCVL